MMFKRCLAFFAVLVLTAWGSSALAGDCGEFKIEGFPTYASVGVNGSLTLDVEISGGSELGYNYTLSARVINPQNGNVARTKEFSSNTGQVIFTPDPDFQGYQHIRITATDEYEHCTTTKNVYIAVGCGSYMTASLSPSSATIHQHESADFTIRVRGGSRIYTIDVPSTAEATLSNIGNSTVSNGINAQYKYEHIGNAGSTESFYDRVAISVVDADVGGSCKRVIAFRANITPVAETPPPSETPPADETPSCDLELNGIPDNHWMHVGGSASFTGHASGGSGNYKFWIAHAGSFTDHKGTVTPDIGTEVESGGEFNFNFHHTRSHGDTDHYWIWVQDKETLCKQKRQINISTNGSAGNDQCLALSENMDPRGRTHVPVGSRLSIDSTLKLNGRRDDVSVFDRYEVSKTGNPAKGTVSVNHLGAGQTNFVYTSTGGTGNDQFSYKVIDKQDPLCTIPRTKYVRVIDPCDGSYSAGNVVIDNTANNDAVAIEANLGFDTGCVKEQTTIGSADGRGVNAINISDYQVIEKDGEQSNVKVHVGAKSYDSDGIVSDYNAGTSGQLNYFKSGEHLFDLDRIRATADWLSNNIDASDTDGLEAGTYGTISLTQFLDNIAHKRTMYGVVRVTIPLQKGTLDCEYRESNCRKNALGETVASMSDLYGFCDEDNPHCVCAPAKRNSNEPPLYRFKRIRENDEICGNALPWDAKIKVKGALLWDFVDASTGEPIPLSLLPFHPRKLYFKVEVPVMINSAYDVDDPYFVELVRYISSLTAGVGETTSISPTIDFAKVPVQSKHLYQYLTGQALDETKFGELSKADQYHLLFPSGYSQSWAEAFDKLNISAATWSKLPRVEADLDAEDTTYEKFKVPEVEDATLPLTENDIRSPDFEDIPVYLYSGGLIDMHDHASVSGLVYVPQAMELEAVETASSHDASLPWSDEEFPKFTRHVFVGAIVVRDGFYIQAGLEPLSQKESIALFSTDPTSYANIATLHQVRRSTLTFENGFIGVGGSDDDDDEGGEGDAAVCITCGTGGGEEEQTDVNAGSRRWQQVYPQ